MAFYCDMISTSTGSDSDRRQAQRHRIRLSGRYMLVDRSEWNCETIDLSQTGVLLRGQARPSVGQTVVAYLTEVGRIEGTVVRFNANAFALQIKATDRRREKLNAVLDRLKDKDVVLRQIGPGVLADGADRSLGQSSPGGVSANGAQQPYSMLSVILDAS